MKRGIPDILRNLFFSESKPQGVLPLDIALVSYLIVRETDDHFIYDSAATLAARLGCERKAIARSIERLREFGWITTHEQWNWNPKTHRKTRRMFAPVGLSVNPDNLPTSSDRAKRSAVSADAKEIAVTHTAFVTQHRHPSKYKTLPKGFDRHQESAAQRLLDKLGSTDAVYDVIDFAAADPRYKGAALGSLYRLRQRLDAITAARAAVADSGVLTAQ